MSKELTPLEALERLRPKTTYLPYYTRTEKRYYCDIIETALKDYEYLKLVAKPLTYERIFNLLNDKDIDIWLLKHCDYENYCRIRKLCLENTGNADKCVDCDKEIINLPTEDEFNELKEVLK